MGSTYSHTYGGANVELCIKCFLLRFSVTSVRMLQVLPKAKAYTNE